MLKVCEYKEAIEKAIENHLRSVDGDDKLFQCIEYALKNGGKRFRPSICLLMVDALDRDGNGDKAALAIEYFHTASLLADDLPCMDDDDERRGKPSSHKVFGEALALLASYGLIGFGYELIYQGSRDLPPGPTDRNLICSLALENAGRNTGYLGATGGQILDLCPPDKSKKTLEKVIRLKTGTLFEIAFVFGWLYGFGDPEQLPKVKKLAQHYGMAFQIADDLGDMAQDEKNGRSMNYGCLFGRNAAEEALKGEIEAFYEGLRELDLPEEAFSELTDFLLPTASMS